MRFFISGPRMFGGLIRPGISFGMPRGQRGSGYARPAVDYIYVIEGTHGLVKIGKSNDPDVRRATLQTGSAHLLRIASVTPVPIIWVEAVEHKAHDMLDAHRGNGEWFAVSPNVAVASVYAAAERLGVDLTSRAETTPERQPMVRGATAAMLLVIMGGLFGVGPAAGIGVVILAALVLRRLVKRPASI